MSRPRHPPVELGGRHMVEAVRVDRGRRRPRKVQAARSRKSEVQARLPYQRRRLSPRYRR